MMNENGTGKESELNSEVKPSSCSSSDDGTGHSEESGDTDTTSDKKEKVQNTTTRNVTSSPTEKEHGIIEGETLGSLQRGMSSELYIGIEPMVTGKEIMTSMSNLENDLSLLHSLYAETENERQKTMADIMNRSKVKKRVKSLNMNRSAITNKTAYSPRKPKKKRSEGEDPSLCGANYQNTYSVSQSCKKAKKPFIKRCLSSPVGKVGDTKIKIKGEERESFLPPLVSLDKESPPPRRRVPTPYPKMMKTGGISWEIPNVTAKDSDEELWTSKRLQPVIKHYHNSGQKERQQLYTEKSYKPDVVESYNSSEDDHHLGKLHGQFCRTDIEERSEDVEYTKQGNNINKIDYRFPVQTKVKTSKIPAPAWSMPKTSKRKDTWEQRLGKKGKLNNRHGNGIQQFSKQRKDQKYLEPLEYLPVPVTKSFVPNRYMDQGQHPMNNSRIPKRLPALNNTSTTNKKRMFTELTIGSKIPVLKPIKRQNENAESRDGYNDSSYPHGVDSAESIVLQFSHSSVSDSVSTSLSVTDEDTPSTGPSSPVKFYHRDDVKNRLKLNLIKTVHNEIYNDKGGFSPQRDIWASSHFRQIYPRDKSPCRSYGETGSSPPILNDCTISENLEDVNNMYRHA